MVSRKRRNKAARGAGFTLIELMAVILILGILVGLSAKGLRAARLNAKKARALVEMKSIETAVKAYVNKYGKPPVPEASLGRADYGSSPEESRGIVATLAGKNEQLNPARIVFLEPRAADGFLDPWGEPYLIALDGDLDGRVELEGETVARAVAIVAVGYRALSGSRDPDDVIASWR